MSKPQSIQRRRLAIIAALLLATFNSTAQTFEPGSEAETASLIEPTKRVVKLLDTGEMGTAWDEASKVLKGQTGRLVFISGVKGMRAAAGDVRSRKIQGIGFLQDMPDAPKGRYAAALFETEFSRITVSEKFVFMQEGKAWRLAGYFMHKRFKSSEQ